VQHRLHVIVQGQELDVVKGERLSALFLDFIIVSIGAFNVFEIDNGSYFRPVSLVDLNLSLHIFI